MTDTQWLLDLVEEATPGQSAARVALAAIRQRLVQTDGYIWEANIAVIEDGFHVSLDLARLCVEQHEALAAVGDYAFGTWDGGREKAGRKAEELTRAALAHFAELKP